MAESALPTSAIAELFPRQGQWTEEEYLALDTNRIVELSDGKLEVAAMPTDFHQAVLGRLYVAIFLFVTQHALGQVRFAPLPVRLWPGKVREPDLVFMSMAHANRVGQKYWGVPDLAAEVLSEGNPDLDRVTKKEEYARAGIPEYWIVDPQAKTVEVYLLAGEQYRPDQTLALQDALTTSQLPGFSLPLSQLFAEEW